MILPTLPLLAALCLGTAQQEASLEIPRYFPRSTVKICQLTADRDKPRRIATRSLTAQRAGLRSTDLGCSFEHQGKLWFLFGDCRGGDDNRDAMAWSQATDPEHLELNFPLAEDGKFRPIEIPGVAMKEYEVPSHGISLGGVMYLVTTAGHSREKVMERSLLVRSTDEGAHFEVLHELSRDAFINVAMVRANREQHPSLPTEDAVLLWGSGDYRRSNPKLAYIPAREFGQKKAMRYFKGLLDSQPVWTEKELEAAILFEDPIIGELSVAWLEPLGRWLMLYKGKRPTGIVMRTSEQPWGPWSEPEEIFHPWEDMGYANFLHASWGGGRKDSFHDQGHRDRWGGPYAPFIVDRFTRGDDVRCTVYYTMSTWNPYQVVLMSTDLGYPDRQPLEFKQDLLLPGGRGWVQTGPFLRKFKREGVRHVSTQVGRDNGGMGVAHRSIEATLDGTLEFSLHGGEAELVLVRGTEVPPRKIDNVKAFYQRLKRGEFGDVVEAIAGPNNDDVEVKIRWNLSRHVGHPLRLYLIDSLRGKWGSVNVSEILLRSSEPARSQ